MTTFDTHPRASLATSAYQGYLRGLRTVWKDDLYRRAVAAAQRSAADDAETLEQALLADPDFRLYAWLEHRLQQLKYYGRWGLDAAVEDEAPRLRQALDDAALREPQRLQLDPGLTPPAYYLDADFHQHRGGVSAGDQAALLYEWAADQFSFALQDSTRPYTHFAERVLARAGAGRILDIGCGFGKSTLPFKRLSAESEVTGVDLSAPGLRLAHLRALEAGLEIDFRQAAAESLPYPDGHFDTVACYWLLHELPAPVIAAAAREAFRVLRPGGVFASRDMHTVPGGLVGRMLHLGHAARNNEPFLPEAHVTQVAPILEAAGFRDITLEAADRPGPAEADDAPLSPSRIHVNAILWAQRPEA